MLKILTFAYKTSYFQFGTLKYIDVFHLMGIFQSIKYVA